MNWLIHLFGIHKPVKGYILNWHTDVGFYTECEVCKQQIVRDYSGKWNTFLLK